jgi:hypothetical protein
MAQDLTVNIKTTSDVPQAMDKAKSATVSLSKQVEDIQKKFSTGFKDIFLGFTAPMVLIQHAISAISSAIEKSKQEAKEGLDLLARGETMYASSEEKKMANFFKAKKARDEEKKSVEAGRFQITREFLDTPEGVEVYRQWAIEKLKREGLKMSHDEAMAQDFNASNPHLQKLAMQKFLSSPEGMAYAPIFANEEKNNKAAEAAKASADAKDLSDLKNFASKSQPGEVQGYGNVIGVGANVAMEMAQMQIDELRRHTELLQMIATKESVASVDFSKGDKPVSSPSRAKLLSGK